MQEPTLLVSITNTIRDQPLPPPRVSAFVAIPPMFMLFAGYFAQITILSRVLLRKTCYEQFHKACDELNESDMREASASAGLIISYVMSSYSLLSIATTSWLAAASDVIGRRIVLAGSAAFMAVSAIGTVCVVQLQWSSWCLLGFYAVGGLGGTFTSFNAAAFAFTADVSAESARPSRFAILESFIFLGGVAGVTGGAHLLEISDSAPFAVVAALYLTIVLYVPCFMPETVHGARVRRAREVSCLGTLRSLLATVCPRPSPNKHERPGLAPEEPPPEAALPWLLVFLAVYCADNEGVNLLPLLTKLDNASALEMSPAELGMLTSAGALSKWLVLFLAAPLLTRCLTPASTPAISLRVGAAIGAASMALWGFAQSQAQLYILVCTQSTAILSVPAIRSMLSAAHPKVSQGRVLGAVSVVESLAMFVTPLLGGNLWAATVRANLAPLTFIILAAVVALAAAVSFCLRPLTPLDDAGTHAECTVQPLHYDVPCEAAERNPPESDLAQGRP